MLIFHVSLLWENAFAKYPKSHTCYIDLFRRLNAATNCGYWIPPKSDNSNTPTCDKHQPIDAIFPTALRRKFTWGLLRTEGILFTVLQYIPISDAKELKRNGGGGGVLRKLRSGE
jgi:hypothetical protein